MSRKSFLRSAVYSIFCIAATLTLLFVGLKSAPDDFSAKEENCGNYANWPSWTKDWHEPQTTQTWTADGLVINVRLMTMATVKSGSFLRIGDTIFLYFKKLNYSYPEGISPPSRCLSPYELKYLIKNLPQRGYDVIFVVPTDIGVQELVLLMLIVFGIWSAILLLKGRKRSG